MHQINMNTASNCLSPDSMNEVNIGSTVAYSIVLVASLVGNSLVGIIVYKMKTMRKTINFFIVNMAMFDLLFSVFAFPWVLTEPNAGSWLIRGILGHILSKMFSSQQLSPLLCLSKAWLWYWAMDRFGALAFSLPWPLIGLKLWFFSLILGTWFVPITTQFPYYFVYEFVESPEKPACEVLGTKFLSLHYIYFKIRFSTGYNRFLDPFWIDGHSLRTQSFFSSSRHTRSLASNR